MVENISFPRPPQDITPKAYFSEWLPTQIADYKDMVKDLGSDVAASVSMKVTGENGGDWAINLENGEVSITEGLKEDSVVTVRMSDANFSDAVTGKRFKLPSDIKEMAGPLGSGMSNPIEMIGQMKDKVDGLKGVNGSVGFKVEGDDPFEVFVKFAGPMTDEASATLVVSSETARGLASGELNPQAAFMAGKLQIQGDMSLLMQLAQFAM